MMNPIKTILTDWKHFAMTSGELARTPKNGQYNKAHDDWMRCFRRNMEIMMENEEVEKVKARQNQSTVVGGHISVLFS